MIKKKQIYILVGIVIVLVFLGYIFANRNTIIDNESASFDRAIAALEKVSSCNEDLDCIVTAEFGCPLGCQLAVNKNADLTGVRESVEQWRKFGSVCETCIYPSVQAVCQVKRCVTSDTIQ